MKKIILASKSPRRKKLLKQVGLSFSVDASNFDERSVSAKKPGDLVRLLSLAKVNAVAHKYKDAIVIGSDTIVFYGGEVLGKPETKKKAKEMLRKLSGKTHSVFTGYAVIDTKTKKNISGHVETKVTFKNLTDKEISAYVNRDEVLDRAGAYGIQDSASLFVEYIKGDYSSVVGLPLIEIYKALKKFGVDIIKYW